MHRKRGDVQWFWEEYVTFRWPESRTKSHVRSTWICVKNVLCWFLFQFCPAGTTTTSLSVLPVITAKPIPVNLFMQKKDSTIGQVQCFCGFVPLHSFFSNPNVFSIIKYTSQKMCYLVFISRQTVPKSGSKTARISSLFSKTNGSCSGFTWSFA